jgi:YggT family protein
MNLIIITINRLFAIIEFLIIARIIMSYIPSIRESQIYNVVFQLTEPILFPIRELLYKFGLNKGMIDFSPIIAFLIISVLRSFLISIF